MNRRIIYGGLIVIALVAVWLIFNYYHYSAPRMDNDEIARLSQNILKNDADILLSSENNKMVKKEFTMVKVLETGNLNGKTYVIFKLDYTLQGLNDYRDLSFDSGNFILGYRWVEQDWTGISLNGGMEFESACIGVAPADCGYHPEEGIFFGFCKDTAVDQVLIELDNNSTINTKAKGRLIFTKCPPKQAKVNPRFFDVNGEEIEPVYGFRIAFITENEKEYEKFNSLPLNWWMAAGEDLPLINHKIIDAIWVFPDQTETVLKPEPAKFLQETAMAGIPVLFPGNKDIARIAETFSGLQVENSDIAAEDIEGVYLIGLADDVLKAGFVTIDNSATHPIFRKSVELRYNLKFPGDQKEKADKLVPVVEKEVK